MKKCIAVLLAALLFSTPAVAKVTSPVKPLGHAKPTYVMNVAHFMIYGKINEGTAHGMKIFLRDAGKLQANVSVYITSPGGNAIAGLAIHDMLSSYPGLVTCTVGPLAASAAFLILQACDHRVADPRSMFLAHRARVNFQNDPAPQSLTPEEFAEKAAEEMRAAMELMQIAKEVDIRIAQRLKLTIEQYLQKVGDGQDWRMTAEEALKANAIDELRPDGG